MSQIHKYTCSAQADCNQTFAKFADLKKHEAAHSPDAYYCTWPECDFVTLMKNSYDIHYAKHTGKQREICPHDGCNYKTHDPALLTRHRTKRHGYVPLARGRGASSATGSGRTQSASSSPQPQPPALISSFRSLPQPSAPFHQYQYQSTQFQVQPPQPAQFQPQPMQLQPHATQFQPQLPQLAQFRPQSMQLQPHAAQFQLQPIQFQPQPQPPTQSQLQPPQPAQLRPQPPRPQPPQPPRPQPIQFQPHSIQSPPPPAVYDPSLGVLYGPSNTVDEYTIYTGPAMASHGWTEGCMCPELMQWCPSEILESEYLSFLVLHDLTT
ncbi:hypothetical protein EDD22DRAFT_870632 [Suillus occidentalis]|nr:hypothetical protein EDD22DRAFT_870632 [Suillus occidentalis]